MLFTFNKFWKTLIFIIGSWFSYTFVGFEFTIITILSLIYCSNFTTTHRHI